MKEIIQDFKAIMADKHERQEFIGSFACVVVMMVLMYFVIVIFH